MYPLLDVSSMKVVHLRRSTTYSATAIPVVTSLPASPTSVPVTSAKQNQRDSGEKVLLTNPTGNQLDTVSIKQDPDHIIQDSSIMSLPVPTESYFSSTPTVTVTPAESGIGTVYYG